MRLEAAKSYSIREGTGFLGLGTLRWNYVQGQNRAWEMEPNEKRAPAVVSGFFPVGGFNPSEKYESKWESSPGRGENKKCLKPTPRETTMDEDVPPIQNGGFPASHVSLLAGNWWLRYSLRRGFCWTVGPACARTEVSKAAEQSTRSNIPRWREGVE